MPRLAVKATLYAFIIISLISMPLLLARQPNPNFSGHYKTIDEPYAYINSEFKLAKAENKKLLFVLGANWCHDSDSLANKLGVPYLSTFIKANYRLSMVDIGYLERGFKFIEKANMLTYYATPTVLIFDSVTEQHLNVEDMHIWAHADKINQLDTNAYFEKYAGNISVKDSKHITGVQQKNLLKLEQFINQHEQRIKTGFSIVGPLLERHEAGENIRNYMRYWFELSELRTKLPTDIMNIRAQILASSDREFEAISFPNYPLLPWE